MELDRDPGFAAGVQRLALGDRFAQRTVRCWRHCRCVGDHGRAGTVVRSGRPIRRAERDALQIGQHVELASAAVIAGRQPGLRLGQGPGKVGARRGGRERLERPQVTGDASGARLGAGGREQGDPVTCRRHPQRGPHPLGQSIQDAPVAVQQGGALGVVEDDREGRRTVVGAAATSDQRARRCGRGQEDDHDPNREEKQVSEPEAARVPLFGPSDVTDRGELDPADLPVPDEMEHDRDERGHGRPPEQGCEESDHPIRARVCTYSPRLWASWASVLTGW